MLFVNNTVNNQPRGGFQSIQIHSLFPEKCSKVVKRVSKVIISGIKVKKRPVSGAFSDQFPGHFLQESGSLQGAAGQKGGRELVRFRTSSRSGSDTTVIEELFVKFRPEHVNNRQ